MIGAWVIEILTNDLITVRAEGNRVKLSPKSSVEDKHRDLVRKHKDELLRVLRLWPNGEAPAVTGRGRRGEQGRRSGHFPAVVTRRR